LASSTVMVQPDAVEKMRFLTRICVAAIELIVTAFVTVKLSLRVTMGVFMLIRPVALSVSICAGSATMGLMLEIDSE